MKQILRNLRTWLIHRLGGYTHEDLELCNEKSKLAAIFMLKLYADSLYGLPAEEWCKKIYSHIKKKCDKMPKLYQ